MECDVTHFAAECNGRTYNL